MFLKYKLELESIIIIIFLIRFNRIFYLIELISKFIFKVIYQEVYVEIQINVVFLNSVYIKKLYII